MKNCSQRRRCRAELQVFFDALRSAPADVDDATAAALVIEEEKRQAIGGLNDSHDVSAFQEEAVGFDGGLPLRRRDNVWRMDLLEEQ